MMLSWPRKKRILREEKEAKDAERQAEIDAIQKEKDEEVAPTLAKLEHETGILNELTEERNANEKYYNEQKARAEVAEADFDETVAKLEEIEKQLQETEKLLNEATTEAERETAEAQLIKSKNDLEQEEKEREHAEFLATREKLEAEIATKDKQRLALHEELTGIKQEHLNETRQINDTLPDHLRKDIPDTISLERPFDHSRFAVDDSTIPEPDEVLSEPETEAEVAEPEPEPKEPEVIPAVTTEPALSKEETSSQVPSSDVPKRKLSTTSKYLKKLSGGNKNSPTSPKEESDPSKPGFGKKFIKFMTTEPPKKKKQPKSTPVAPASNNTLAPPQGKSSTGDEPIGSELKNTFSGFSQGSDIHEEPTTATAAPTTEKA
ncbi:unnamed protein product [Ambrosiozyma monospora]|uniref:Unnamed protein product n=1 Tax=Ambrosiozyma monospora TaxID=43982 RepID=A0ACB5SWV3_AMBMO|nr:unnamed protein product [Ambrosiozyma monospora]